LNGIFFIPIASVLLAGFFIPSISATGAKVGLLTGFGFYILTSFLLDIRLHFIHIWGIEFILNIGVMYWVSSKYPRVVLMDVRTLDKMDLQHWKYTKPLSFFLCFVTLLIYILLGKFS